MNVKYLEKNDLAYGRNAYESIVKCKSIDEGKEYNIIDIIELNEMYKYFEDSKDFLEEGKKEFEENSQYFRKIKLITGKYFSNFNDSQFKQDIDFLNDKKKN